MFINFLEYFLHLDQNPVTVNYLSWYEGAGSLLGCLIPLISSLVFVLLFYYLWSRVRATTTFHWLLTGLVNCVVVFAANLLLGRMSLLKYIDSNYSSNPDLYSQLYLTVSSYPLDLWFFALNGIFWSLVFFFLLSWALKRWSPSYNIPFGRKNKKIGKTR